MVGYPVKNLDDIESIYHCSHCSLLLRDPVQFTDCGHRQCQSCLDDQQGDMIVCFECHEKTRRENLKPDRGFRNDMQTLSIICALCHWNDILKNYQNHLNQNHTNLLCNYCNEKFPSVNDLYRHQQLFCEKITVYCPLKQFGCEEMMPRISVFKHYLTGKHQQALINFIFHCRKRKFHRTTSLTADHFKEIEETMSVLLSGIQALNDDLLRIGNESVQIQNELTPVIQKLPMLKTSIDEHNAFVDSMKPFQETLERDVLLAKQKFDEIKAVSYDGINIWRISGVQEKMAAAQFGTQITIDSPPFYSSPTGYKMCLRLYLDGDGNARRTHMSLFFVLMRSEFDAILHFPFCFKLRFCLYDQINQQNHILGVLRPDIRLDSYQRPRSDMNNPVGLPKFASLEILKQEKNPYILDDTMFIKTMIDFSNIPDDVLSYALNLHPGLTIQTQQAMIREKIENQQQQRVLNSSTIRDS